MKPSAKGGSAAAPAVSSAPAGSRESRDRREGPVEFWFEKSQAYAGALEFARRVMEGVAHDSGSGTKVRDAALRLVGVVAGAVSTARDHLPARLQIAYDEVNAVAGVFVLHTELAGLSVAEREPYRENLSAVAGLLYGLRRSLTQER